MKKFIFLNLFLMVFDGAYGQILSENNWILGSWVGTDGHNNNYEFVFNNDGTGKSGGVDIIFSINGNSLTIFSQAGTSLRTNIVVYRINNQRMVLYFRAANSDWYVNLNKIL
jgi:hypothetical protein